jgi:hypothetical protein
LKKKKKKTLSGTYVYLFFSCFFKIRFGRRGEKERELIPNSFKHMGPRGGAFFLICNFCFMGRGLVGGVVGAFMGP